MDIKEEIREVKKIEHCEEHNCSRVATLQKVLDKALFQIIDLETNLKDCRNELCLRCGQYHESYLGACDGCRWKEEW